MKVTERDRIDFSRYFKGQRNFMTPQIVRLEKIGTYIIEVSRGKGIGNNTIYGITILERVGLHLHRPQNIKSQCCDSMQEVDNLLNSLKKNSKNTWQMIFNMLYMNCKKEEEMKYEVIWEERHKAVIEADSYDEAREKAQELDSNYVTYQEITSQEIIEIK